MMQVGEAIGKSIVDAAIDAVKERSVEILAKLRENLETTATSFLAPIWLIGIIFLGIIILLFIFMSRAPVREEIKEREERGDILFRLESLIAATHRKYVNGEIPRHKYIELMRKNEELIRKVRRMY
jgi:hypothetical protein